MSLSPWASLNHERMMLQTLSTHLREAHLQVRDRLLDAVEVLLDIDRRTKSDIRRPGGFLPLP